MLSMVAINMLLFVSKHFVYELPVCFFLCQPTWRTLYLPSFPPKIYLPKYGWTKLLPWGPSWQGGGVSITDS